MTYRGFATLELIELPDRVVATLNRPETRNAGQHDRGQAVAYVISVGKR
ncbi:MAG: hypothetical protein QOD70_993 [Frankiales bacterium]|jgi:hypothetical protein|nr:hypothetical protein [Frankiales bacterium]